MLGMTLSYNNPTLGLLAPQKITNLIGKLTLKLSGTRLCNLDSLDGVWPYMRKENGGRYRSWTHIDGCQISCLPHRIPMNWLLYPDANYHQPRTITNRSSYFTFTSSQMCSHIKATMPSSRAQAHLFRLSCIKEIC